ncbi:hypothetical protein [Sorangium sp. So ce1335]|uniref:hypothetical protein n=1 Tax=Sorangium sp. So ce1335 TaxID=3133335 RepID=UPI003F5D7C96
MEIAPKRREAASIRGIQVSAQLAAAALLVTLYENEAQAADLDTAARYKSAEDEKSWFETALEWAGPFGLLESSSVALGPNFSKIKERSAAVISETEKELGRSLTSEEAGMIRQDIYNIWAESATSSQH